MPTQTQTQPSVACAAPHLGVQCRECRAWLATFYDVGSNRLPAAQAAAALLMRDAVLEQTLELHRMTHPTCRGTASVLHQGVPRRGAECAGYQSPPPTA